MAVISKLSDINYPKTRECALIFKGETIEVLLNYADGKQMVVIVDKLELIKTIRDNTNADKD